MTPSPSLAGASDADRVRAVISHYRSYIAAKRAGWATDPAVIRGAKLIAQAEDQIASPLSDLAALRTRAEAAETQRDEARFQGRQASEAAFAAEARVAQLEADKARLVKGIEDFRAGDYPNPRSYRPKQCPHGQRYHEDCDACDAAALTALIA